MHHHKDFRLETGYPYVYTKDLSIKDTKKYGPYITNARERRDRLLDAQHGWFYNRRLTFIAPGVRPRAFGTRPLRFDFRGYGLEKGWIACDLPKVPLVTGLLIRRQYYRGYSTEALQRILNRSLTNLDFWRWEKWLETCTCCRMAFQQGCSHIRSSFQWRLMKLVRYGVSHFEKSANLDETTGHLS